MDVDSVAGETDHAARVSTAQIVGIVLVRNEDVHIERAISNVLGFCDRILVADHQSTDRTLEIVQVLAARQPKIEFKTIGHPSESHGLLQPFVGSNSWVFGVDGDEIYDPGGLARLRPELLAGRFQDWWMILGNVLNCDAIEPLAKTASGYLTPPCRSITKLYNFSRIDSWHGDTPERLHSGDIAFRTGCDASRRLNLFEQHTWEDSPLRCLHTCFVARSSADAAQPLIRPNIMEIYRSHPLARVRRAVSRILGRRVESDWKQSRYRRGERVTVDAAAFFP